MSLKDYRLKRNFESTPEPEPKDSEKGSRTSALHFVIHKHNASHLHYDFRIELNGVLKSWAVPKGPSMNPNDKRLAMMVEDHPYEYGGFEGIIPKGNYGGGEVIIWDRGVYSSTETSDPIESQKLLNAGLAKGHLALLLNGEKLKGIFDLVKIAGDDKNSWLLIKRDDEYSLKDDITKLDRSVVTNRSIEDMKKGENALDWQLKLRIDDSPIVEMPNKIEPMMATSTDEPFNKEGWIFEIKWDGYRAISEIRDEGVELYSRNLKSFGGMYGEVLNDLKQIKGKMIFDGELVVLDDKGQPDFQLMQNYPEEKKGIIIYYVFDILYLDGHDLKNIPLIERKKILKQVMPEMNRIKYSDHIENEGTDLFEAVKRMGLEGIIAKRSDSFYQVGVRSSDWIKIKQRLTDEVIICGFTEPREGRGFLGSLITGKYNGDELVFVGHVGGGFSDKQLRSVREKLSLIEVEKSPFKDRVETNTTAHWVKPQLVCEVEYSNYTSGGILRQPVFKTFKDVDPKDVSLSKNESQENYFKTDIKEKEKLLVDGRELIFTNPSKIYWPEQEFTKKDLLEYYMKAAKYILPFLKDRPKSLLRHPHGISEDGFFQKNMTDTPEWIQTAPIKSDSESRTINYLICNDLPTLIYMINLGCIEINPWNSRLQTLDNPDFIVIDLDPEKAGFENAIEAALQSKEILDELGLKSYVKTSGKRGLHIYVPIKPKYTYEQVRNFSEILARITHKKLPDTTSIIRNPLNRQGKVYMDFLQNRIGQTMSAPYSVRPISGAQVSTPLKWEEVKPGLTPAAFNITNIFDRLETVGDLWSDFLETDNDLEKAIERLENLISGSL